MELGTPVLFSFNMCVFNLFILCFSLSRCPHNVWGFLDMTVEGNLMVIVNIIMLQLKGNVIYVAMQLKHACISYLFLYACMCICQVAVVKLYST